MASRGDKVNGNGEEQIVEVKSMWPRFFVGVNWSVALCGMWGGVADPGGGVPMLHLYGEAGGCPPVPSLLEAVLLRVRAAMADGAAVAVPALPGGAAPARTGQLPLGRGSDPANRDHATVQLCHPERKLP